MATDMGTVTPEDPGVVIGGPLDPTSPEGTPPEGHVTGQEPAAPIEAEPLYRGMTGEIKTQEELKAYAKSLEALVVERTAQNLTAQALNPPPVSPTPAPAPGKSFEEEYAELIYSDPQKAARLTVEEAKRQIREENDQIKNTERQTAEFWNRFYEKNHDLNNVKDIVQSVVNANLNNPAFRTLRGQPLEEFISKETRKMIDMVQKAKGFVETKVPSGSVVMFGGSKEPVPTAPSKPQEPQSMIQQLRSISPRNRRK